MESGGLGEQAEDTDEQRVERIAAQQARRFQKAHEAEVKEAGQKDEPNLWLRRVGWATHLDGLDGEKPTSAVGPIQEDEQALRRAWQSFQRVAKAAQGTAQPLVVGYAALFEVNRKEASAKATKPFDGRMEEDSWERYMEVFRNVLCCIWRTQKRDENEWPAYVFTKKQGRLFDDLEGMVEGEERQEGDRQAKVDRACLDFVVSLFDHELKHNAYESALISALAVLGLRGDGGWVSPLDYTTTYSAVIKLGRMLVLRQAYEEREDEVEVKMRTMDEKEAREQSRGMFALTREKVRRFMVVVGETGAQRRWIESSTRGRTG